MDPLSFLPPTLRIDQLQQLPGDKQQQAPFNKGQILQGLINGKSNNQFILDVKGEQFLADSKIPLQVGQRLELQVTALSPRISLQILTDPLTQNIGKSLHLLHQENQLLPQTTTLVAKLPANTLSPASQQTLELFSSLTLPQAKAVLLPQQPGVQLTSLLSNLFTAPDATSQKTAFTALTNLINQLSQALPREHPNLPQAQLLGKQLDTTRQNAPLQQLLSKNANTELNLQVSALLQSITGLTQNAGQLQTHPPATQTFIELFLQFMRREDAAPTPILHKLLTLTDDLLRQDSTSQQKPVPTGKELEQIVTRLGTNLEQLLARGKQKEAAQTLKSALLEISHSFAGNTKIQPQAEQLTPTNQLYQMLQIRLAGEDLAFLPLPLPFLEQGYLLVEPDHKQGENSTEYEKTKKYSLHLNLEGLGNLRVELQQQESGMRIRFFAEDGSRAQFLAENREELQEWLTATKLESVQFLTGAEDPTRELLERMVHGQTGVLNTRA